MDKLLGSHKNSQTSSLFNVIDDARIKKEKHILNNKRQKREREVKDLLPAV